MDLKSYAVLRKLTKNSELLEYLLENKPVPIDVLEKDMKELIEGISDKDVDLIINDYPVYLQKHVPLALQPDGDNIDIHGEIEDTLVETIEMLHAVDRHSIVEDLIVDTVTKLGDNREVVVEELDLLEDANEFVKMTQHPIFSSQPSEHYEHNVVPIEDARESLKPIPEPVIEERVDNPIMDESFDDMDFGDLLPNEEHADAEYVDVPDVDLGFLNETLPDSGIVAEAVPDDLGDDIVFEEPEIVEDVPDDYVDNIEPIEQIPSESENIAEENGFKKAYDYLVEQLKARQLDKRLPGLHLT